MSEASSVFAARFREVVGAGSGRAKELVAHLGGDAEETVHVRGRGFLADIGNCLGVTPMSRLK